MNDKMNDKLRPFIHHHVLFAAALAISVTVPLGGLYYLWQRLKITEIKAAELSNQLDATEIKAAKLSVELDALATLGTFDSKRPEGTISFGNGLRKATGGGDSRQGQWNTSVGTNSLLESTTGWAQTAVGYNALRDSGVLKAAAGLGVFGNTAVGYNSMVANRDGFDNTAVGTNTLLNNEDGFDNSAVGINALRANLTGHENAAIGFDTLMYATDGSQNVALGEMAGRFLSDEMTKKTSGNRSIYIGYQASGGEDNEAENEIVIGYKALGVGSNSIVLGNSDIRATVLRGEIKIDRPPQGQLEPNLAYDAKTGAIVLVEP